MKQPAKKITAKERSHSRAGEMEPTAAHVASSTGLFLLLGLLFYWGTMFMDNHGGGFDPRVYQPYQSVASIKALQPFDPAADFFNKGQLAYGVYCANCHQPNGLGNEGLGFPPLGGSEWVTEAGPGRLIRIASKGLGGPVEVKGKTYNNAMPAMGDSIPGEEKDRAETLAAILTYIRGSFGNNAAPVTPEQVAAVRAKIADHPDAWNAAELQAIPPTE